MQWTDRIRQVKIILVTAAVIIAVASLLVSHFLVRDLSNEERHRMEVWAQESGGDRPLVREDRGRPTSGLPVVPPGAPPGIRVGIG